MKYIAILLCTLLYAVSYSQTKPELLKQVSSQIDLSKNNRITEVVQFGENTMIATGDILDKSSKKSLPDGIIYKTTDNGLTWKKIIISPNTSIYDVDYSHDGKIWLAGSDHNIHYSENYGDTWTSLKKPFSSSDGLRNISMLNSNMGIATSSANDKMVITNDNWQSFKTIATPSDQNLINTKRGKSISRINNILYVKSLLLLEQNNEVFCSNSDEINWKRLNSPMTQLVVDKNSKNFTLTHPNEKLLNYSYDLQLLQFKLRNGYLKIQETEVVNQFLSQGIKSFEIISSNDSKSNNTETIHFYEVNDSLPSSQSKNLKIYDSNQLKLAFHENRLNKSDIESIFDYLSSENQITKNNILFSRQDITSIFLEDYSNYQFKKGSNRGLQLKITNNLGHELILSNHHTSYYSLPWTIKLSNKSVKYYDSKYPLSEDLTIESYNPYITEFIQSITPEEIQNYDMLQLDSLYEKIKDNK